MKNKIKKLVNVLNKARNDYFNESTSDLSDYEYDKLFDELKELEEITGIILANSPTQNVGYTVQDKLNKSVHKYPMLSLDKTKKPEELISFIGNKKGLLMLKMDGLTCAVTYDHDGNLILCETRGDGVEGSDITENAKTFVNLPKKIPHKGGLVVFGEAIIDYPTFYKVNEKLPENSKYKNPRNLCSGSVQVLDSKVCAEREVKFIAWRLVEGYDDNSFMNRLDYLDKLGFETVQAIWMKDNKEDVTVQLETARETANKLGFPIDGCVCSFDDVKYGESLGATSHHLRMQLAFKYGEDREITTLRKVEFSPSRTGVLNPVGIFDAIELAGTEVSRASLSNLSIMEQYNIKIGAQVEVSKRNEIIPKIESCDGNGEDVIIPTHCPVCNALTEIKETDGAKFLYCSSESCPAKLLGKLNLFVSKEGLNIDGLSEATLQTFIEEGYLHNAADIYKLKDHAKEIMKLSGFGKRSVDKLLVAIEDSRITTMANFIRSLGIDLIGKSVSKDLAKFCNNDIKEFNKCISSKVDFSTKIDGFGEKMNKSLYDWFRKKENLELYKAIYKEVTFKVEEKKETSGNNNLDGKTFCITGKLVHFDNRDSLVEAIAFNGGKYVSSISNKTNYLINNDANSSSSKNIKAKHVGCQIITEEDFMKMIGV